MPSSFDVIAISFDFGIILIFIPLKFLDQLLSLSILQKHRQPLPLLIFERIHKINKLMEPTVSMTPLTSCLRAKGLQVAERERDVHILGGGFPEDTLINKIILKLLNLFSIRLPI